MTKETVQREYTPTVAIASSQDAELGNKRAPLDSELTYEQVNAITCRALELDNSPGSLQNIIKPNDWVVVKPNIVTSRSEKRCSYWRDGFEHKGQNTDLRVIKSIISYLIEKCRPRRITIAEGGAEWRKTGMPGADSNQNEDGWTIQWPEFDNLSYADIVSDFDRDYPGLVDIVDLNWDRLRFEPVPDPMNSGIGALQLIGQETRDPEHFGRNAYIPGTGRLRRGYWIPSTILDCDKLISCPAMKIHLSCGTTLVMKNYVGIVPQRPPDFTKGEAHRGCIQRGFVDLFAYHPAEYGVIEGFWGTEGNGPQWGENAQHNVVIAGSNAVAVDAVGSAAMGFNPWDLDYLHYGALKGFGSFDVDDIMLSGNQIEDIRRDFAKGGGRRGVAFVSRGNREWMIAAEEENGSDLRWRRIKSEERYIDLSQHFQNPVIGSVWCSVEAHSRRSQSGQIWAGSDGDIEAWLNDEMILSDQNGVNSNAHKLGEHKVSISLRRGVNHLLLRVRRSRHGFGFTALLCDDEANGLPDIKYRLSDNVEIDLPTAAGRTALMNA